MNVDINFLWGNAQATWSVLLIGLGLMGFFVKTEITRIKEILSVIVASDPELAKKVEKFTKKDDLSGVQNE